jgi:hypothetical protein
MLKELQGSPRSLADLYERIQSAGSAWSRDQLLLFLLCKSGVEFDSSSQVFRSNARTVEDVLKEAIGDAVRSFAGKPTTAAQVRARLPQEIICTDEQIRALAKNLPGIKVLGPGLLVADHRSKDGAE